MASLFEYFNTGDNAYTNFYADRQRAQTFTPSKSHYITSVKLKLYKSGSPTGTITVSIKETDASGHPTGSDLCSGTISASSLTTNTAGAWYEIPFITGYNLIAGKKYAIVVKDPTDTSSNYPCWREDTSDGYSGGNWEGSTDGGSTWTSTTSFDLMFEEWGYYPTPPPTELRLIPIADGQHVQIISKYNENSDDPQQGTYMQIQVASDASFSTILKDTGQLSIAPLNDGDIFSYIIDWMPATAGTYYYRVAYWNDGNYTGSANWGTDSFVVGFPAITSLAYRHDKEMYTFTAEIEDTYTKPPIVSLSVDNNSYLMELKKRLDPEYALDFDGVDDYVEVSDSSSLDAQDYLTIEAWIYPIEVPSERAIIVEKLKTYYLTFDKDQKLAVYWYGTSFEGYHVSNATIPLNQWTHVAAVWDGSYVHLYINGELDKSVATTTPGRVSTEVLRIGFEKASMPRPFKGLLDEISVWTVARTQEEIQSDMNGELTGTETGLGAYWKFNEGEGTTAYDSTANGNDGTIYGAEWSRRPKYIYTYRYTLPLERGEHEYHVEVGNVWTVLIGDTNYLHTQYTLQEKPRIEVFAGNRKIAISDPVLTENTIPDVNTLDFDTEEDLREGVGNLTVRFTANEIKEYTMHVTGIRKKTGGWHIKAEETAKEDLKQTINFSAQAISSLAIVQSILPDYTIHGGENLTETIYLQSFQNERISDVLQRILLINGAAATARNKHLYIYPQSGDSKAVLHATDPDTQYNADFRIVNKLREYYVKKQYPVPQSALTNYDASNWGGTASNELQTGNGVLPKNPYCLKGNGTIYRSVDFAFTDYDQFHIGFAPDSDNTLEIRLETDASNYRKYIRTFSGRKGAGFVLTADSADATVTKDITFSTKYIHLVQGRTSQACTVKIELKKSGSVVASSTWQTTEADGFFGQYFDNVECDTITISFTNLYVVGSSYGVNCENLQIEEHKQVYETTGTHTFVSWQQKYVGTAKVSVSQQYLYKGDSATVNGTITLGAVPALSGNQKYALNLHKCRMTFAYKPTADYVGVKYTSVPLDLTAHVENGVLKAEINGTIKNTRWYEIIIIAYKVDYNFTYLIQQTVTDGAWVWEYANYKWASSYNLFDYATIPLSAFSTVGNPTNQVNTIRLIASGDTYYDEIYVTATNPAPKYVEAENEESIKNHWLAFEIRTTDGWSSKESAQAFAQAFVNKFGEPGESYEKNVSFWTDINIGDMVECDGKQMQVYCIVYNLLQGTKRIMVGRKITDTLEFLKQTSAKIQALEKNIM